VPRYLLPQVFTIAGMVVICLGLLVPFLDLYSLFGAFIPAIGVGVVLAFIGLGMWSLRIASARRRQLAAFLLVGGIIAYMVAVSNVHIWGLFFLIAIPAALLGLMLLVMSFLVSARNRSQKRTNGQTPVPFAACR